MIPGSPLPYFLLVFFLLGWTGLSQSASDRMRNDTVSALAPLWRAASQKKESLFQRSSKREKTGFSIEASELMLENQRLKEELEQVREWIAHEAQILSQKDLLERLDLLEKHRKAIPAKVIYRDPGSWGSSLWIEAGEEDNQRLGFCAIARNSPVVQGASLVGVVDYVGSKQSRVRLITDSALSLAVRVMREGKEPLYLAKGELHGNGSSPWRVRQPCLKGVGFNYDYADAQGCARELRTGRPLSGADKGIPLIGEGDLLITSGLDGVFPFGIFVATVAKVEPLQEGSVSYAIDALPSASLLNDLKTVFVLPSLGES